MSKRFYELILAVRRKCQGNEEQIQRDLGLSPAEFHGLIVLEDGGEITGCEFAERMALSLSRGSRVLSKLAADGHIKTRLSPQDRRTTLVSLTAKGKKTRRRMLEHMEACEKRICRGLGSERLSQVRDALELLESTL